MRSIIRRLGAALLLAAIGIPTMFGFAAPPASPARSDEASLEAEPSDTIDGAETLGLDALPVTTNVDWSTASADVEESQLACTQRPYVPEMRVPATTYGPMVWWRLAPDDDARITVEVPWTEAAGPRGGDVFMTVYEGDPRLPGSEIACAAYSTDRVSVDLAAGGTYYVSVLAPFEAWPREVTIRVTEYPPRVRGAGAAGRGPKGAPVHEACLRLRGDGSFHRPVAVFHAASRPGLEPRREQP